MMFCERRVKMVVAVDHIPTTTISAATRDDFRQSPTGAGKGEKICLFHGFGVPIPPPYLVGRCRGV